MTKTMNAKELHEDRLEQVNGGVWDNVARKFFEEFWVEGSTHYCPMAGQLLKPDFDRMDQEDKVYDIYDLERLIIS